MRPASIFSNIQLSNSRLYKNKVTQYNRMTFIFCKYILYADIVNKMSKIVNIFYFSNTIEYGDIVILPSSKASSPSCVRREPQIFNLESLKEDTSTTFSFCEML